MALGLQTLDGPPQKRHKSQTVFEITTKVKWNEKQVNDFEQDLCRLFIATNTSWNTVSNPIFSSFIQKYAGVDQLPSRQKLSGPVLARVVHAVEGEIRRKIEGGLATGQCDGWKNIAKTSVIASIITVGNQVSTIS